MTYKIYGISQGEKEIDLSGTLPWVVEPGTAARIEFYLWCLKSDEATVLVDTGMTDKDAKHMCTEKYLGGSEYVGHKLFELGIDPRSIETIIVSHLHGDHFSAHQLYPKATFYIQRKDVEFHTGPGVKFRQVRQHAADMPEVIRLAYANRIRYLDGDEQIAPGIRAILVGGHTPGSQVVVVTTNKGETVICSDAIPSYQHLTEAVFGHSIDVMQSLLVLDKIRTLASSPDLIIPGHDPRIMERFPNPIEGVVQIA